MDLTKFWTNQEKNDLKILKINFCYFWENRNAKNQKTLGNFINFHSLINFFLRKNAGKILEMNFYQFPRIKIAKELKLFKIFENLP